jgi:hypothetical protein
MTVTDPHCPRRVSDCNRDIPAFLRCSPSITIVHAGDIHEAKRVAAADPPGTGSGWIF